MIKFLVRLCALFVLFACGSMAPAQSPSSSGSSLRIAKIEIKNVGPAAASEELIRSNIRVKVGDAYLRPAVDEDVRNLYATGLFYNIRVSAVDSPTGVVLTYSLQGKPRITDIKYQGNTKFSNSKLRAKTTSKVGDPLDEVKLFTDSQEIQKMYQKKGYPRTQVKYVLTVDENAGRGTATFEIIETPKVKILEVDFVGAKAFPEKKLRKVIKTRAHWMFSWITGSGYLKDDQFQEDKEKLIEFYRDKGYIDFEIREVQFINPTPKTMIIKFVIYEGQQYKVGAVNFTGNKLFTTNDIATGMRILHTAKRNKAKLGPHGLVMDVGDTFTPKGMGTDTEQVEDYYGAKGYIDVTATSRNLRVLRIPNTERGTIDLEFQIDEGQKSYIEKVEIRGNTTTRDKVIRRELAVSPGEVFDMVRVKLSQQRLEGLGFFERVDTRAQATEPPIAGRKNLIVNVDEKQTGHVSLGAGFSSVDSLVGMAEYTEGNFDLLHPFEPPYFRGGGQKLRLRIAIGTQQQDYEISFLEPWFLGRKLQLGVNLYYRELAYLSPNNLYTETQLGGKVGVTRALGSDFLRGGLNYTLENIGIDLTSDAHPNTLFGIPGNVPPAIQSQVGNHLLSTAGGSLTYDTRNSTQLPNKGQRTELTGALTGGPLGGDASFYKIELHSAWYFKGLAPGHVLEIGGRAGVAQAYGSTSEVPFYSAYYLGGLYDLRGFKYRNVSPRQPYPGTAGQIYYEEPVGGDTFWFASVEYSIPIFEKEHGVGVRFAVFYDVGGVGNNPYSLNPGVFDSNWGLGIRLNLPIGPIRLDYGIPITSDQFQSGGGQFQFGVGWERPF